MILISLVSQVSDIIGISGVTCSPYPPTNDVALGGPSHVAPIQEVATLQASLDDCDPMQGPTTTELRCPTFSHYITMLVAVPCKS